MNDRATNLAPGADAQARRALASAADVARRSQRMRQLGGAVPFLWIWGLILMLGHAGSYRLFVRDAGRWIEPWWLGTITLGLGLCWLLQWCLHLRPTSPWRLWGLMLLLFVQGWIVERILAPMTATQGAVYTTGLVLIGGASAALIFNLRLWFALCLVLLTLTYAGYVVLASVWAIHLWLGGGIAGSMLLAAAALTLLRWRLMRLPGEEPLEFPDEGESLG